jgi:hypothetical protein
MNYDIEFLANQGLLFRFKLQALHSLLETLNLKLNDNIPPFQLYP